MSRPPPPPRSRNGDRGTQLMIRPLAIAFEVVGVYSKLCDSALNLRIDPADVAFNPSLRNTPRQEVASGTTARSCWSVQVRFPMIGNVRTKGDRNGVWGGVTDPVRTEMLVGPAGLEPATSSPPDSRATKLRHGP